MEIQVEIGYSLVIGPKMESITIGMRWNHGKRGVLDRHDLAWSRQGSEKVYVQHLMKKNERKYGIG